MILGEKAETRTREIGVKCSFIHLCSILTGVTSSARARARAVLLCFAPGYASSIGLNRYTFSLTCNNAALIT